MNNFKPRRPLHPLKSTGFTKTQKREIEDWLTYEEDFLRRPHPRNDDERSSANRIAKKLSDLANHICEKVL